MSGGLQQNAYETEMGSPLSLAVSQRDRDTMVMVRQALAQKQVMLAYQPVVSSMRPDTVAFYEGLIRVVDTSGRVIPAKDFMETVETHEMGRILDCHSIELGLKTLAQVPGLRLSINMSARSIGYPKWREALKRGLARQPDIAERLILEITESSAMIMPDLVNVFMNEMQSKGIAFALDDFGAGYTAFRYLKEFYFDIIKIDGQFIRGVASNPDNQVLTNALVSIAQHFEMFTVAEFVENREDAEFLIDAGLDCMQGHYFGVPTIRPSWLPQVNAQMAG
ncbi:EAL domain-containing protein [Aliiroseovarius sp. PTFE2010]|uniref:EAL domain-containing protein n=1 Tax=Aliiroseovarius sp. PTFE2010 TaxID=3417190 RepID=UPI003CF4FE25